MEKHSYYYQFLLQFEFISALTKRVQLNFALACASTKLFQTLSVLVTNLC